MGRKLTIYMIDGVATGSKTVEIGNWSGKAIYSPRASLKLMLNRDEFDNPGVYLLKGHSTSTEFSDSVYIGEAEELRSRLKQHLADRDFESVICFISKDDMLTKAHVKYLESRLIAIAKKANNSYLENGNQPKLSKLSEADVSDMEYFLEQIQLVLPTVGLQSLLSVIVHPAEGMEPDTAQEIYKVKSKSLSASMVETTEGYVVLAGSEVAKKVNNSMADGWRRIRSKLLDEGALKWKEDKLIFTEDTTFASPSAASSVILGRQAPGPISWIDKNGRTYKEIQESNA
ncbi:GIY-YIG nuclease family protein [Motiliproteus sp.]|uniref:GIY-YIG nuclease family protein n=1 Tax=Motiliproteus sp. TaxID=1898955 RepID=UPI003BAD0197